MTDDGSDLIFLFSLPRSGSTLTQKIIGSHRDVATATEPWLLLPLLYSLKDHGVYAEYGHFTAAQGVGDFINQMPGGHSAYIDGIRRLALDMYDRGRGDRALFLDKTPRYHLIANEVLELFPGAKAIFLWRQPLAVAGSLIETFGKGRWNLDKYSIDLYTGVDRLLDAQRNHASRSISVRFEDLVANPNRESQRMFEYLGLDPELGASGSEPQLIGRWGDKTGDRYSSITRAPLSKWPEIMANPVRRRWCRQYLDWLGDRLPAMGYDRVQLLRELGEAPSSRRGIASDAGRIAAGYGYWRVADRLTKSPRRGLAAGPVHQS